MSFHPAIFTNRSWFVLVLISLFSVSCGGKTQHFHPGTYSGEGVLLKIQAKDAAGWRGDLRVGTKVFPLEGETVGQEVVGFFGKGEGRFPFSLKKESKGFLLESEGNRYHLVFEVPKNPLAQSNPKASRNPLERKESHLPKKIVPKKDSKLAQPPGATPSGQVAVSGKLYKHPLGFRFRYPDGWRMKEGDGGVVMLTPPDIAKGPYGLEEVILVFGDKANGMTDVTDGRISRTLDQELVRYLPFLKRKGKTKKLRLRGTDFGLHEWEGKNPRGKVFSGVAMGCLLEGYTLGVLALMPKEQLGRRRPMLEAIAGSIQYKEPDRDQRLVGVWRNETYYSSGSFGSTTVRELELHPNGTSVWRSRYLLSMEHKDSYGNPNGSTTGDTGKDRGLKGRWFAQKDQLVIQWANGNNEEYSYYREKNSMLLTPHGGGKKQLWQKIR
jgi:hypothetical protein